MRSTSRWPCPGGTSSCAAAPERATLREIGPVPRRDRSYSGSRSVRFRVEIGRTPVWGCSQGGSRMRRPSPPRAGSTDACVGRGWWVLHTRMHSVSVGTAESCGTAMSVVGAVLLPCAASKTTAPTRYIRPPHPKQATHHKLEPEPDRSRREFEPISTRNTTDLAK